MQINRGIQLLCPLNWLNAQCCYIYSTNVIDLLSMHGQSRIFYNLSKGKSLMVSMSKYGIRLTELVQWLGYLALTLEPRWPGFVSPIRKIDFCFGCKYKSCIKKSSSILDFEQQFTALMLTLISEYLFAGGFYRHPVKLIDVWWSRGSLVITF